MKIVSLFASLLLLLPGLLSARTIAPPEFDTPQKRLFFFVCSGNIEGIDAALAEGADINAVEKDSYPLLHISIFQENHEVFDHLLKKGVDIHMFSAFGNCNALSLATIYDRREMVLKLLDAGADPNAAEVENFMKEYSAIAYAALYGHVDLLKMFAARGGDLERPLRWPMWRGIPPEFPLLSVAAQHGGLEVVRYLVEERGHAVNPAGKIPVLPPLSVAVRYNNMEVAKCLISKGADVNAVGHDYYYLDRRSKYRSNWLSPLGVAARYNRAEMVELLFAHGAKIREDVEEANHPMYWADWAGYYRVIEEFEKQGYTFDKWAVIERQFRSERSRKKESEPTGNASDFAPTFLRGHTRQWEIFDEAELAAPLRLAVVADSQSEELADLLTVALSGKAQLELIERSALDAVLQEQQLNLAGLTDGKTLSRVSKLLDAQALVLIETLTVNKQQVFQLRLVNSILGLQFGRHFIERDAATLNASIENYAGTVSGLINTFRRNYEQAIPLSLVNVRSDLGTLEGLKIENTLKQLLELQFLGQPSVILTQREGLETLIREKDLGGREEAFRASSLFVDVGVQLDPSGDQVVNYTVRIESASGESYSLKFDSEGKPLNESVAAICRAVMTRIEADYSEADSLQLGMLSKDAETYFKEAMWYFNLEEYESCIERMRTAISLGYNDREIWDYYFRAVEFFIEEHRDHRGNDAMNREVLALERERLMALEGVLKLYRADIHERELKFPGLGPEGFERQSMGGFYETFQRFRPVAMQRRYAKELQDIERQFVRLINEYINPCYAEPKAHGKLPLENSLDYIFRSVDLMAHLKESEYNEALEGLMAAFVQRGMESRKPARALWFPTVDVAPPVAVPIWNAVSRKYLDERGTFHRSLERLQAGYMGNFSHRWTPELPISVEERQELGLFINQAVYGLEGKDDLTVADSLRRKILFKKAFGLNEAGRYGSKHWLPREGSIPLDFKIYSEEYEIWRVRHAGLSGVLGQEAEGFYYLKSLDMALEAFKSAYASGRIRQAKFNEKKIEALEERRNALLGTLPEEDALVPSELPVRLWSLKGNAFSDQEQTYRLLHTPIVNEDHWVALVAVSSIPGQRIQNSRYALLQINPETSKTQARWLEHPLINKVSNRVAVARAGRWLAVASVGQTIKMINLDSLDMKELPGYVPSISPRTSEMNVCAHGGRFMFFLQPESLEFGSRQGRENSKMQILMRYDPEAGESEVVYNTRRNPPETILDGSGSVFDVLAGRVLENALIIYEGAHGQHFWVDCDTLEVRKTNRREYEKLEGFHPFRFNHMLELEGVKWSPVFPRLGADERAKLPEGELSLVRRPQYRDEKGRLIRGRPKAVVPKPIGEHHTNSKFFEEIQVNQQDPVIHYDNEYFGQDYGFVDFGPYGREVLWGIFKMSDLAEALKNSTEL